MIKKFIIGNDSLEETLELELEKPNLSGIYVRGVTGLGYPNSDIPITELALSDINYYNHSVFQTRNIVFTLSFVKGVNVEKKRQIIYKFFPSKVEIKITISTTEQSSLYVKGYVETLEADIFNKDESIQVSILCVNPFFINGEKSHELFEGATFSFFSDKFIHNGLLYYLTPKGSGIDCLRISYPAGYISFGREERFRDPYDTKIIDDSLPDDGELTSVVNENMIKPKQKILIDTSVDGFGIYILDANNDIITDITSKCYVYGDYPSISYGNNDYSVLAYSVKESDKSLEYWQLQVDYNLIPSWDTEPITEPSAHPIYYEPGTVYYERPLNLIVVNSGFSTEVNTSYWKWPKLLIISFYDCAVIGEEPPIERLVGNIIVNGLNFSDPLTDNISYHSQYYLVCKENSDEGNDVRIGQTITVGSFSHLPADVTKYSKFLPNPFYDGKNFIINTENDFKNFLYRFLRYSSPDFILDGGKVNFIQKYYQAVKDGEKKNIFEYESCTDTLQSDLYWDDYKAGL